MVYMILGRDSANQMGTADSRPQPEGTAAGAAGLAVDVFGRKTQASPTKTSTPSTSFLNRLLRSGHVSLTSLRERSRGDEHGTMVWAFGRYIRWFSTGNFRRSDEVCSTMEI